MKHNQEPTLIIICHSGLAITDFHSGLIPDDCNPYLESLLESLHVPASLGSYRLDRSAAILDIHQQLNTARSKMLEQCNATHPEFALVLTDGTDTSHQQIESAFTDASTRIALVYCSKRALITTTSKKLFGILPTESKNSYDVTAELRQKAQDALNWFGSDIEERIRVF